MRFVVTYACPVAICHTVCKRKADLRSHIRKKHESDNTLAESILSKSIPTTASNKQYSDPGFFIFRGRKEPPASPLPPVLSPEILLTARSSVFTTTTTALSVTSSTSTSLPLLLPPTSSAATTSSILSSLSSLPVSLHLPSGSSSLSTSIVSSLPTTSSPISLSLSTVSSSSVMLPLSSSSLSSSGLPPLPLFNTSSSSSIASLFSVSSSSSSSTQTVNLFPVIILPDIPESLKDMEEYKKWITSEMDRMGRVRMELKERIRKKMTEKDDLLRERELRRKLEGENRQLQKELAELKGNGLERYASLSECMTRDERVDVHFGKHGGTRVIQRARTGTTDNVRNTMRELQIDYNMEA